MNERAITEKLNQERAKTQRQDGVGAKTSSDKTPNTGLGIIMLMFAIIGLIPGIGMIVRGTLKLQQKMGHPKNKNSLISKLPGNIPNVLSMFFTKSK
ncbi:MAG: hypothetical protein V1686_01835 [Patescibacteria group bacterium]